ncbi:MAG: hypothetical protein QOG28_6654 [Trebonia sp.]|nr:hypothetical protein [Trebonia sp.]
MAVEAELARLRAENVRLLKLLRLSPQQAAPPGPAQGAFFEAAPGIVHHRSPQDAKVAFFGALFAARTDVYAVRYDNAHTGKGGWIPAVRGGWRKGVRHEDRNYLPLTAAVLAAHLKGEAHNGLYPLHGWRQVLVVSWKGGSPGWPSPAITPPPRWTARPAVPTLTGPRAGGPGRPTGRRAARRRRKRGCRRAFPLAGRSRTRGPGRRAT